MWIPRKIYEGLPALYLTLGVLLVLGAVYIGVSHGLMPGYALLGLSCMIAGMLVRNIRRNARTAAEPTSDRMSVGLNGKAVHTSPSIGSVGRQ